MAQLVHENTDRPWDLMRSAPPFNRFFNPDSPNFECAMIRDCSNCVRVLIAADCRDCFESSALTNCQYMFQCSDCEDCSGLVRESGKRGVHRDPQQWVRSVAARSKEIMSFEEHEQVWRWVAANSQLPPWDLDRNDWAPCMPDNGKIALIALGSRGDVQPVIALALGLQKAGFCVRTLVNYPYDELVRAFSLDVVGCPEAGFMEKIVIGMSSGRCERSIYEAIRSFGPSLILYPILACIEAWVLEEQLGVPTIHYLFQAATLQDISDFWRTMLPSSRAQFDIGLGVPTLQGWSTSDVQDRSGRKRPVLQAFSKEVAEGTQRYSLSATTGVHITGYWVLDSDRQQTVFEQDSPLFGGVQRKELLDFLGAGPPPVYIGWGSMVTNGDQMGQLAVRALMQTGQRGIILGGEAHLNGSSLHSASDSQLQAFEKLNVLWLQWAPHEWLLPLCCMAVHHGGCGTTAAALRAGLPSVVVPVAFDQHFWAKRVTELGVGVATKPLHEVTADEVASAMGKCSIDEVIGAAAALGKRLQQEDGVTEAVDVIKGFLAACSADVEEKASGSKLGTKWQWWWRMRCFAGLSCLRGTLCLVLTRHKSTTPTRR
mmetsp:Transcript_36688/g.87817  ORF Transcript_36688/g.87817 Transcript_36688/m.87817 type:complete len:599 (-) Transcript_36688:109-1905(-)